MKGTEPDPHDYRAHVTAKTSVFAMQQTLFHP
jgi:hypothetical protein